jgi:2-C-methyl-D-erythritol 4-phosphate cytidylyltransferase
MNSGRAIHASSFDAVIVAGGAGTRLGISVPKAFVELAGRPMLLHSLEQFERHALTVALILVVPAEMTAQAHSLIASKQFAKKIYIVKGGKERWQSVHNGASSCSSDWIMVHDAARPFVTHAVIDALLEKTTQYDAIITVTPETDTVRTFEGDRCKTTIDRATLARVGTPQLFRASLLKESFALAASMPEPPTDEAMLMEKMGIPVGLAWGDPMNFKITTQSDLMLAEALCLRKSLPLNPPRGGGQ